MRVRGDNAPANAFSLEEQPKRPGFALIRFYANVKPFEEVIGALTISGYEYDEYHLEAEMYDGLADDIVNGYDSYFAQAKLTEAEQITIPALQQQVSDLEDEKKILSDRLDSLDTQVTDTQEALCDVYELMLGGAV